MYKLKIASINCMSCVHNIDDALKEQDPGIKLTPDLKNKIIYIESTAPVEILQNIIEEAGYPVQEVMRE